MASLEDFLKRLREDPTKTLQEDFENFLVDLVDRGLTANCLYVYENKTRYSGTSF